MNPRHLLTLTLLLLAVAPAAGAQSLYKCDAKGAITIQSESCPAGSVQVWRRDATPDAGPTPEELSARAALAQAEAERAAEQARIAEENRRADEALRAAAERAAAAAAVAPATPARKSECTLAHEFSDAVDAKTFLQLSDIQRTRLRDWVADQCRDPDGPVAPTSL
jgi:hypothetical protein